MIDHLWKLDKKAGISGFTLNQPRLMRRSVTKQVFSQETGDHILFDVIPNHHTLFCFSAEEVEFPVVMGFGLQ